MKRYRIAFFRLYRSSCHYFLCFKCNTSHVYEIYSNFVVIQNVFFVCIYRNFSGCPPRNLVVSDNRTTTKSSPVFHFPGVHASSLQPTPNLFSLSLSLFVCVSFSLLSLYDRKKACERSPFSVLLLCSCLSPMVDLLNYKCQTILTAYSHRCVAGTPLTGHI